MTKALEDLFNCTGRISTMKYDLKFGQIVEGAPTKQVEGELARLESIEPELRGRLTPEESIVWDNGYRQIQVSADERRAREKAMDMENVDRDSI